MQASGASRTIKALFPVLPRKNEITLRAFKNGPGRVEATFEKDRNAIYKTYSVSDARLKSKEIGVNYEEQESCDFQKVTADFC